MRMYVVQTADTGDLAALRDAARDGRAAAMSRRRALAAGKSALAPASERVRTGPREAELRAPGGTRAPVDTAVAIDGVGPARLGRTLSMQRRRQMAQGKQALDGGVVPTAAAAGAGARVIVLRGGAR